MNKLFLVILVLAVTLQFVYANDTGDDDGDDLIDYEGNDELKELVKKEEAVEFLKRLLHPFSTRNEEQKRETVEVYEEKCKSIVPTKR